MGVIWTPGERSRQPRSGATINWANPLARSLSFLWTASITENLVAKTKQSGTVGGVFGAFEGGVQYTTIAGSGNGLSFGTEYKPILASSTEYTIVALAKPASGSGHRQSLFTQGDDGAAPYRQYHLSVNASDASYSSGAFAIQEYDGGLRPSAGSDTSKVDGRWHMFAGTRSGTSSNLYYDGVLATSTQSTITSASSSGTTGPTLVSGAYGSNRSADFPVAFVAVFRRALTPEEHQEIARNPWQLFEPENDPVFYSLGGGGTPVTIDGNVGAALGAGLAANVASAITVASTGGAATGAGLPAGVASAITVAGSVGAALADGRDANIASAITVAGSVGAAVGAGLSATVSTGATISASVGAAAAAGLPAVVASPIAVAGSVGAAVASGLPAGISTGNEIAAGTGAAVGAGLAAGVASPITVAGAVGAAVAAGLQASISVGTTIPAGIGAAVALGLGATITATTQIVMGVGRANAAGLQATVTNLGALTLDMPRTRRLGGAVASRSYRLGGPVAGRRQRLGGPITKE